MSWRAHDDGSLIVREPAGSADITGNLVDTITQALATNSRHALAQVPPGDWTIDDTVALNPSNGLLNMSCEVRGLRPGYSIVQDAGFDYGFTHITCLANDRAAFAAQGVRAAVLRWLSIRGQNLISDPTPATMVDDSVFLDAGITAAHCGLSIDEADTPQNASSSMRVLECALVGFGTGVRVGCSGDALQLGCEAHRFSDVYFDKCGQAGIALGHTQTKGIKADHCKWSNTQYGIDCYRYGTRQGFPCNVRDGQMQSVQRAFNLHHTIGTFSCSGTYFENICSIGTLGWGVAADKQPAVFSGCQFGFVDTNGQAGGAIDTHCNSSRLVDFRGCQLTFVSPALPRFLRFHNNAEMIFTLCPFGHWGLGDRIPIDFHQPQLVDFKRCYTNDASGDAVAVHGETVTTSSGQISLGTGSVVAGGGTGKAQVTITGLGALDVIPGDFVRGTASWNPAYHAPDLPSQGTQLCYGLVESKVSDTITLTDVPRTVLQSLPRASEELFRRRTAVAA